MHVNGKKMAIAGLLLALTEVMLILSGVLEFNTLFLLGIASFSIGIIIREYGMALGAAYYAAAVMLGFILAPNKLYCITFGAMGIYILAVEEGFRLLGRKSGKFPRRVLFWILKYVVFNMLFLPILFLFPKLLFAGGLSGKVLLITVLGGQVVLFLFDKGYEYFQGHIWEDLRKKLRLTQ